jgi:hypothetical protein
MDLFGFTSNCLDAFVIVVAKGGKVLNARKNRLCFIIDFFCLIYWCFMDMGRGLYSQSFGCIISILICIYGFKKWGK